jgi:hypothetical protein
MEIGVKARELLMRLQAELRAPVGGILPPFDHDSMTALAKEATWLVNRNLSIVATSGADPGPETMAAMYIHHVAAHRAKRAALVYLCAVRSRAPDLTFRSRRAERIRDMLWGSGMVVVDVMKTGLSDSELAFMDQYRALVTDFGRSHGVELSEVRDRPDTFDPRLQQLLPPKNLLVVVEVVREVGHVETSRGRVLLKPGVRHALPRRDVEILIRSGHLRPIKARNNF